MTVLLVGMLCSVIVNLLLLMCLRSVCLLKDLFSSVVMCSSILLFVGRLRWLPIRPKRLTLVSISASGTLLCFVLVSVSFACLKN